MKPKTEVATEHAVIGLVVMLVAPIRALWVGWIVSILWGWFVTPLGVTPINAWHGAGISLLISLLTAKYDVKSEPSPTPTKDFLSGVVLVLVYGVIVLLFGALYHGLMV